jgi:hypothetical protein
MVFLTFLQKSVALLLALLALACFLLLCVLQGRVSGELR